MKVNYGTYTVLSVSVIWESLPESGRRDMLSLPRPCICTGCPPITFTSPFEAINSDNRFGYLMMTMFATVSMMYN